MDNIENRIHCMAKDIAECAVCVGLPIYENDPIDANVTAQKLINKGYIKGENFINYLKDHGATFSQLDNMTVINVDLLDWLLDKYIKGEQV